MFNTMMKTFCSSYRNNEMCNQANHHDEAIHSTQAVRAEPNNKNAIGP